MNEGWRHRAGPWARATLPDGQQLDVIVNRRTRTRDGRWWYECEAVLPAREEDAAGHTRALAAPTAISVPADSIEQLPGEDYAGVPTEGAIKGWQWALERLWYPTGPASRLHRRDCWQARPEFRLISTAEALACLRAADVDVCDVCRPERALPR